MNASILSNMNASKEYTELSTGIRTTQKEAREQPIIDMPGFRAMHRTRTKTIHIAYRPDTREDAYAIKERLESEGLARFVSDHRSTILMEYSYDIVDYCYEG